MIYMLPVGLHSGWLMLDRIRAFVYQERQLSVPKSPSLTIPITYYVVDFFNKRIIDSAYSLQVKFDQLAAALT